LGTSMNLNQCAQNFKAGYFTNTEKEVDRVILVQMSFLEDWARLLGHDDFFAIISRDVADIDHHDELVLAERKSAAAAQVNSLIRKSLFRPFGWKKSLSLFSKSIDSSAIYFDGISPEVEPKKSDFVITEWNLGGAKSSRYVAKNLIITATETSPDEWYFHLNILINHLGTQDAPLSQDWKGKLFITLPDFLGGGKQNLLSGLSTNGIFKTDIYKSYKGTLENISIFNTPSQNWNTQISVRLFPQQNMQSDDLLVTENIGTFFETSKGFRQNFSWSASIDETAPFLTIHKPIDPSVLETIYREKMKWSENDLVTELQFNEAINLKNLTAELKDRDHTVSEITENPQLKGFTLLDNQTTLLLNWSQDTYQKDERFYLTLSGIEDVWGNAYINAPRTVITR